MLIDIGGEVQLSNVEDITSISNFVRLFEKEKET
jgi:hypothetical protein